MATSYKDTLNLPQTDFSMRASLPEREPEALAQWTKDAVYARMVALRKAQGAPSYIFHDGPPYANGNIHHGHILNKTLKDFVAKYKSLKGFVCEFVPGWDCHGLPIEHQVERRFREQKLDLDKVAIRKACRQYALEWVDVQRDEFKRMLVLADWDNPYLTMSYDYEAKTVRELGRFLDSGLVYRGLRPIHWDWASQTALAEAEVEYKAFTTHHVYVKFPFAQWPEALAPAAQGLVGSIVIWTTTPWTLPANLAIALNPELDYQLVKRGDEAWVVAQGLLESVLKACRVPSDEVQVLQTFKGSLLCGELGRPAGLSARHPWLERDSALLPADYVTLEQGTGCVHTAPGHGQDDFALGREHGLEVLCPVNPLGRFIASQVEEFGDMHVFEANPLIAQKLAEQGSLLNSPGDKITIDRYPHGWRSKSPVIFRATTQWFVAMEPESVGRPDGYRLRDRALEAIDHEVTWTPRWGRDRIHGMMTSRPDWCISRQRAWGVPITALHCNACGDVLATKALADHVASLVEQHGVDVWFERDALELAPEGTSCPSCGARDFSKDQDILDVWFDSGVSWSAVLETKLGVGDQADLYLEGSDQHRGWFQSTMMCGLVSRDKVPYKTCLTHGFVTDEQGHKYSKSSKNFEPPQRMIDKYGAEILRMWVSAVDYRGDIALSGEILQRVADSYRKVRNTFRFLLGGLDGFDPARDSVPLEQLLELDQWALARVGQAIARMDQAYDELQFHTIYHTLVGLTTVELSSVYMDVTKDRMYCEAPGSLARRSGQTAYWLILHALLRATSPILSFTAQEAWALMPKRSDEPEYVFWADFPSQEAARWGSLVDEARWALLLEVRAAAQRALEEKRGSKKDKLPGQIGSSQEARVTLTAPPTTLDVLRQVGPEALAQLLIVAKVTLHEGASADGQPVHVAVTPSEDRRCERCWNHWIPADSDAALCARCEGVVATLQNG